ncbi:hypothetical protein BHE74_00036479 [Ensete ventricosum]|nr:hypothetical protein BHE74_00036479 [Ensete ventricosum]
MNETWLAEAVPSTTNASVTVYIASSMDEKHPRVDEGESLKKRSKKAALEQLTNASRSTNIVLVDKGKGSMEIEEAPERGYTIQDLCEVEDRVEVDKYFASIIPIMLSFIKVSKYSMSTELPISIMMHLMQAFAMRAVITMTSSWSEYLPSDSNVILGSHCAWGLFWTFAWA